jgi:hypothetical protein
MAHFAKIEEGIVTQVVVVDNEHEENGEEYLNSLGLNGTWIQTSYNSTFRNKYASIGDTYDSENDVFIPIQPHPSWTLDRGTFKWKPPVEKPEDGNFYAWNEESLSWELLVI